MVSIEAARHAYPFGGGIPTLRWQVVGRLLWTWLLSATDQGTDSALETSWSSEQLAVVQRAEPAAGLQPF